jgi:hypothetical protein
MRIPLTPGLYLILITKVPPRDSVRESCRARLNDHVLTIMAGSGKTHSIA